jgi:hypothetical protein
MLIEVDHSSGHMKTKEDGLYPEGMNAKWGGKQRTLRTVHSIPGMIIGKTSKEISKFICEQGTSYRYDLDATIVLRNCSDFLAEKGP